MNKNEITIVKEYKFDNPLIHKIDSIIDNCYRHCHNKHFHTFEYGCTYDIKLTNTTNNEIINITISDKSMGLYELSKKLTLARQRSCIFNRLNEIIIKTYSNLSNINICYYLKNRIPMGHTLFSRKLSQNPEYIQTHCNDRRNPF